MRLDELPVDWLEALKYDQAGLIPAIVQEKETGKVLMMAYMNREALEKTLLTGETWFYSRSRQELWHKGATSGHKQYVKQVRYDCDQDTLLFQVDQVGGACHDGYKSCFYRQLTARGSEICQEPVFDPAQVYQEGAKAEPAETEDRPTAEAAVLEEVYRVIMDRKINRPEGSYTAYLFSQGADKICKKVGEEAAEVIIAAKNKSRSEIIYEVADLWYHTLVLLGEHEIDPAEVFAQLRQRR